MDEDDLCVRIPLARAGCALVWVLAVGLITWDTHTGSHVLSRWGLLLAIVGAVWTVLLGNRALRREEADVLEGRVRKVLAEEQIASLPVAARLRDGDDR